MLQRLIESLRVRPRTLDVVWRYPDRSEPAIAVHPPSLVAVDFETRIRTSPTSTTVVALTDDTGILVVLNTSDGSIQPMPPPAIRTNRDRPIVITEHAVVAVNARDELIGVDPESGDIRWTVEDGRSHRRADVPVGADWGSACYR